MLAPLRLTSPVYTTVTLYPVYCSTTGNVPLRNISRRTAHVDTATTASIVRFCGGRVVGVSYWFLGPRHEEGSESPQVSLVLQEQRLHLTTAPVVYRERKLLPREVVVPQEVTDEVDPPGVEQLGVKVRHLQP